MEIFTCFCNFRYSPCYFANLLAPLPHWDLITKRLRIEGLHVLAFKAQPEKFMKALNEMIGWYKEVA